MTIYRCSVCQRDFKRKCDIEKHHRRKKRCKPVMKQEDKPQEVKKVQEPTKEIVQEPIKEIVQEPTKEIVQELIEELIQKIIQEPHKEPDPASSPIKLSSPFCICM